MISWVAAILCIVLDFWLIPQYTILGAAWATLIAYVVWTGGIAWVSLRLYPVRYSLRQVGWVVGALIVGWAGLWEIDQLMSTSPSLVVLAAKLLWISVILAGCGYIVWRVRLSIRLSEERVRLAKAISSQ
jgi:hypothetical protein